MEMEKLWGSNKVTANDKKGISELNKIFRKKAEENISVHTAHFIFMENEEIEELIKKMEAEKIVVNLDAAHESAVAKQDLSNIDSQRKYIHS